ncbi:DUF1330 domain-containing protein [Novosphingobium sp.]|uniref:DUF1330 domain-containing protein n=1 Tax=Novosphingobium sp. TaxID=1874826 RepID=UPI00333E9A5E
MSAYMIFIRDRLRDEAAMAEYSARAGASTAGHPVEPLVFYGAVETLEGSTADGVVVIRFPDKAAALAWYDSPEYTDARKFRHLGADYRVVIVEGIG